jgi:hypothetical protein
MGDCIDHLKASASQFEHPMLLPVIILSHGNPDMVSKAQQNAQERLGIIERALKSHPRLPGQPHEHYFDSDGLLNLDYINIALSECHQLAICKDPNAYLRVLDGFDFAVGIFNRHAPGKPHALRDLEVQNPEFEATAAEIISRIEFSRRRLEGQAAFREVILQRLDVLRSAVGYIPPSARDEITKSNYLQLSISCGQIDNRVAFQLASAQTKLAFSNRREATAQKTIAILGAFFLPGAYVSVSIPLD